jgi:hypothetical protein
MKPAQEAKKTLRVLNGHIAELFKITETIKKSLFDQNLDDFSKALDKRQGLFVRIKELDESVKPILSDLRSRGELTDQMTGLVAENRKKLEEILKMDEDCRKFGEEFRKKVEAGLGTARANRNLHTKYKKSNGKQNSRFLNDTI